MTDRSEIRGNSNADVRKDSYFAKHRATKIALTTRVTKYQLVSFH
jgi:hypothetical protein